MINFAFRRWRNIAIVVALSILSFIIYLVYSLSLHDANFISGWSLFLIMLVLAAYNVRKKLPFLPLLSSSSWLQFHIYAGFFTFMLFALHVNFRLPNGGLETTLAALYLAVFGSGFVGLLISRAIPKRLMTRGEEVLFERIDVFRRHLREELNERVSHARKGPGSVAIADFYAKRLLTFFDGPRHFWQHLAQSERPRHALLNDLEAMTRYLNTEEQKIAQAIADLVRLKDDLDYQYAHQAVLKYWLFVHIPLTYSLLIISLVHGFMVYAFIG